jgi:hypothetical protein
VAGPLFATDRSASVVTGVTTVLVLLVAIGSLVELLATAVLLRLPSEVAGLTVALTTIVTVWPDVIVPRASMPLAG